MGPSIFEKRLLQPDNEQQTMVNFLNQIFQSVKQDVTNNLKYVVSNYPHYGLHDISHVERILYHISRILGEERIKQLTVLDNWLILLSVYLHDIGMLISYSEEKTSWSSKEFKEFLSTCEQSEDKDLREAANAIQQGVNRIEPLLIKKYVTILSAEFFRPKHAIHTKEILSTNSSLSKLFNVTIPEELQDTWEYLGHIVALHGYSFKDILEEPTYLDVPIFGKYHPRFIAVLLRLGDLCDVSKGRFSEMSIAQFGLLPDTSRQHYYKHKTMKDPQICPEQVSMTADIIFATIKEELPNDEYTTGTAKEDFCQNVVYQHVNWFHMLETELANFARYRDEIFPKNMDTSVPKFVPKIFVDTQEANLSLNDLRFNFSREKAFELIEGYSLYDDPLTFIRELIQNSLDALKQQMWRDINTKNTWFEELIPIDLRANKNKLNPFDFTNSSDALSDIRKLYGNYRINISVDYDPKKKNAKIIFEDNGIGITREDIKHKILQTGASWHDSTYRKKLATMPAWLKPTGSFGIGLHSVFAVSEHFFIETRSQEERNNPKGNIIVLHSGQGNGFVFSRPDETIIKEHGTRVTIEVDVNRIPTVKTNGTPYKKTLSNPVIEVLRKYIQKNIICPLFDVYLYDVNSSSDERNQPLVPKLCDHEVYGKLFDPEIRNFSIDNTHICFNHAKKYDFAITKYRPLKFILWDQQHQAIYEIIPMNKLKGTTIRKRDNDAITYMGIALRDQEPSDFELFNYLHIARIEFLSGDGKKDITADRKRLKKEKINTIHTQLRELCKIVAQFGHSLFDTIMHAEVTKNFLLHVTNTTTQLQINEHNIEQSFSEIIDTNQNRPLIEELLYISLVFRFFIQNNSTALNSRLSSISYSQDITPLDEANLRLIFTQFCTDNLLKQLLLSILNMCDKLRAKIDPTGNSDYAIISCIAETFGEAISSMSNLTVENSFDNEMGVYFKNDLKNTFDKEVDHGLCDIFGKSFCRGFGAHTFFGTPFGAHYSEPTGELGNSLFSSVKNHFGEHRHDDAIDKILSPASNIYLDLLCNDNWAWVLWLSHKENIDVNSLFLKGLPYFSMLIGYNKGYGFKGCNTIYDLLCAERLICPISNLSSRLYYALPILEYMLLTEVTWEESDGFTVTLQRASQKDSFCVSANKDVIRKLWSNMTWPRGEYHHLCPCFTLYKDLRINPEALYDHWKMNYNEVRGFFLYGDLILIHINTPSLLFPKDISGTKLSEVIKRANNMEEAVEKIMDCEQVNNIIEYIWYCRLQEDTNYTKEKVQITYKQFICDYVDAIRESN